MNIASRLGYYDTRSLVDPGIFPAVTVIVIMDVAARCCKASTASVSLTRADIVTKAPFCILAFDEDTRS